MPRPRGSPCRTERPRLAPPCALSSSSRWSPSSLTLRGAHDLFGADADIGDVLYSGTPGGANAALLSWQSDQQLTFVVADAVAFANGAAPIPPPGLYDFRARHATRGCTIRTFDPWSASEDLGHRRAATVTTSSFL